MPEVADLVELLRDSEAFVPELELLAEQDGEIAGRGVCADVKPV